MDTSIMELSAGALALVPIVMALVSLVKIYVDSYWSPLFAIGFGVVLSLLTGGGIYNGNAWLAGILVGLMAAGLYSGAKAMVTQSTGQ